MYSSHRASFVSRCLRSLDIAEVEVIILADEEPIPIAEISGFEKDVVQVAEMKPV